MAKDEAAITRERYALREKSKRKTSDANLPDEEELNNIVSRNSEGLQQSAQSHPDATQHYYQPQHVDSGDCALGCCTWRFVQCVDLRARDGMPMNRMPK